MRINNTKKFNNNKFNKTNKGNKAINKPQKFLYERQQQRQKNRKTEEEFVNQFSDQDDDEENSQNSKNWISQDDSENSKHENAKKKNQSESEDSQSESESHSDSDSEIEIYKEKDEDENSENKKINLNEINLTEEDKEKINTIYLESIENCKDLKKKIEMTKDFIKAEKNETEFGLSYLDSKNGMMIMYETYLILYSMMKFSGINLGKNLNKKDFDFNNDNNIIKNLITCRTFLEKIKNIDFKLRNQIERFIKLSEEHENEDYTKSNNKYNKNNKNENNEEENDIASRVYLFV
jgi:hypothetical protein